MSVLPWHLQTPQQLRYLLMPRVLVDVLKAPACSHDKATIALPGWGLLAVTKSYGSWRCLCPVRSYQVAGILHGLLYASIKMAKKNNLGKQF